MKRTWVPLLASSLLIACVALTPRPARAKSELQAWLEASVRYRPVKRLWIGYTQHLRLDNNLTRLRKVMPELRLTYRPSKYFKAGGGYRLIARGGKGQGFTSAHRVFLDLSPRYKMDRVRLDYRLRAQLTTRESGTTDPTEPILRNRLGLEVATEFDLDPYLNFELFLQLGGGQTGPSKWRLTAGFVQSIGDHDIELFYRLQRRLGVTKPDTLHILGLGYRFSIR